MNYKTFTGNIVHNGIFIVFIRTAVLLSLFFLLTSQRGYSQGKIITVDGREALLFPSGKWKF
ncbi:MAG TPA: hypothetical protein VNJ07_14570, partial [Chitinophagales bacterium]|nr:hypothetical protein [Chitinophagales bacterium]